jgi:hypothetical protein
MTEDSEPARADHHRVSRSRPPRAHHDQAESVDGSEGLTGRLARGPGPVKDGIVGFFQVQIMTVSHGSAHGHRDGRASGGRLELRLADDAARLSLSVTDQA